jgi:hypothetical protein
MRIPVDRRMATVRLLGVLAARAAVGGGGRGECGDVPAVAAVRGEDPI